MFDKIKYYIIAFFSGILAVSLFFLRGKSSKATETPELDKRIEDKKENIKKLENEEIKVESLSEDKVVDYWKNN